jgi:methionyl-tRNA formyltransferase
MMKRVVFMGTPDYARVILEALLEADDIDIPLVLTQPDKPVGRKQTVTPPQVKKMLLERGFKGEIYQPTTLKSDEAFEKIAKVNPDFIVVAAYGMILPKKILDIAPSINLHASLLPRYRGASPIQEAIKKGDTHSGVTAMLMDEGLDTGDILAYSVLNIEGMDAPTLFEKLSTLAGNLILKVLREFEDIAPISQLDALSTFSKKITKSDAKVRLIDARDVYRRYLAFKFWPGIELESGLKLKSVEFVDEESENIEGEILKIEDDRIRVGCKKGSLDIYALQAPSKKEMDAISYIRGKRLRVGDTLL